MAKWTEDEVEFLKENASTMSAREIGEEIDRTDSAVRAYASKHGISMAKPHSSYSDKISKSKRKYDFDEGFFGRDTSETYYWAGALEADGCVRERGPNSHTIKLHISKDDRTWLEKFKEALKAEHPIREDGDFIRLKIYSDKMFKDLGKIGIVPRKTYKNITPNVPEKYVYDYIRGVFDGDGSISKKTSKRWDEVSISFANSRAVCEWMREKLPFHCSFYPVKHSDVAWRLDIAADEYIEKFASLVYDGAKYYMDRKHDKFIEYGMMER